jgi:hypothetical protein
MLGRWDAAPLSDVRDVAVQNPARFIQPFEKLMFGNVPPILRDDELRLELE